ncbi:RTA1 like domain containing protein [Elaphomyces granulatus]|jgi:hypothetical protein
MSSSDSAPKFILYHYDPSLAAACIFTVMFGVSTLLHVFQLLRKRTWYFIPFIVGANFETIGYIGRAISATETPNWSKTPYIMQSLLILLAPALFAASIYMVLARIINLVDGEALSVIKVKFVTKVFVLGDVLSFLVQSTGGAMLTQAKNNSDFQRGEYVIIGGLAIQVISFGFFILVSAIFHHRISQSPTEQSTQVTVPWKKFLWILYLASAFIMIRSVFRIVQYIVGYDGTLQQHEFYVYIFDASLMFLTTFLFNVYHPSLIIRGNVREKESSVTELQ